MHQVLPAYGLRAQSQTGFCNWSVYFAVTHITVSLRYAFTLDQILEKKRRCKKGHLVNRKSCTLDE